MHKLLVVVAMLAMVACGQKGDLYLPDEPALEKKQKMKNKG